MRVRSNAFRRFYLIGIQRLKALLRAHDPQPKQLMRAAQILFFKGCERRCGRKTFEAAAQAGAMKERGFKFAQVDRPVAAQLEIFAELDQI